MNDGNENSNNNSNSNKKPKNQNTKKITLQQIKHIQMFCVISDYDNNDVENNEQILNDSLNSDDDTNSEINNFSHLLSIYNI
eukprot:Pgem_evm1s1877